jgi:hypothetical protein
MSAFDPNRPSVTWLQATTLSGRARPAHPSRVGWHTWISAQLKHGIRHQKKADPVNPPTIAVARKAKFAASVLSSVLAITRAL